MSTSMSKKRKVRAFMAETGTNYTTALRAYDADIANRYAEADAAAASGLPAASEQVEPRESAPPAAAVTALTLQFSQSTDGDFDAHQPGGA